MNSSAVEEAKENAKGLVKIYEVCQEEREKERERKKDPPY
jgi:hypothetical protein